MTYTPRRPDISATLAEATAFLATRRPPRAVYSQLETEVPHGHGPVLVLPPIFKGDDVMAAMRDFLARIGYQASGWGLGIDIGPTTALMRGAQARLAEIFQVHGRVALVGVSMGGLFARWLALNHPEMVRQVITCGSPFRDAPQSAFIPVEGMMRLLPGPDIRDLAALIAMPLPVPGTFVYSRRDGIVAWQSCIDPARPADNAEVSCHHVMMMSDPSVFRIVARRLADPACPLW